MPMILLRVGSSPTVKKVAISRLIFVIRRQLDLVMAQLIH